MNYRELGRTGLKASEIGMGCEGMYVADESGALRDMPTQEKCKAIFDFAETNGINYFDLYSPNPVLRGAIGHAMKGRREKFIVQSHLCSVWKNNQYERSRNLDEVKAAFEDSMRLLQLDFIDVGMIHYCDSLSDWDEIVSNGILDYARELKRAGRIHYIGLSSHNPQVALKAIREGGIEVLMFSVNPCYYLQPANEDVEQLWADENYAHHLTNMDPERQELYETANALGVGITVMKAFGGGDLLDAKLSPAGAALTVAQCVHYCLTRPAVATVCAGAHSIEEFQKVLDYETATDDERDYAAALANFPNISWKGHCMYCNHCLPCPKQIDIAMVTKFLNLARAQGGSPEKVPETVREHYKALEHHASDCVQCGACEKRCPFTVGVRENMNEAVRIFGL